ncbi:hypothetical protein Q5P01_025644 [Channa striata]|uniref:B-cell receptor CD22 n=1 Tax=Channa striata TaxID=64152 RepID=A0AA88LP74_CHASR|nr:hypothetical protein Q5P01_025644 [Channa striata]
MQFSAASSGFVVVLLSVSVIQGENDWGVDYPSTQICGIKGSTVDMHSTYTYPSTLNNKNTTVDITLWFTKGENHEPVDLKTDSDYTGRVRYHCENNKCTLTITDLRLSDSAVYKFRFISNQKVGRHTGLPGVTLSVTDLQMQVIRSETRQDSTWAEVKCHSNCLPDNPTFIWYKNGQKIWTETTSPSHAGNVSTGDYSCAVKGHENFPSPSLYPPKVPSVSVSPSAEIVEGRSVTLTCSSNSKPAANYTWYKENEPMHQGLDGIYQFTSISSEDRGIYYCKSENKFGWINSSSLLINVLYSPKVPSVSVSPSAEIVEGSSVTLTCSSDSNPAANYTWYKENEDSPKASGQIFTITDFRPEHSGNYYCEAQNTRGCQNSNLQLLFIAGKPGKIIVTLSFSLLVPLFALTLFVSCYCWNQSKKKKNVSCNTEPNKPTEMTEPDAGLEYENISAFRSVNAANTDDTYEQCDFHNVYGNIADVCHHGSD